MTVSKARSEIESLLSKAGVQVNGNDPWDIQVHDDRLYPLLLKKASLGLGEAYMDGWWDAERIDQFISKVLRADLVRYVQGSFQTLILYLQASIFNMQSRSRARSAVTHHYDMGNELYFSFLDPFRQYSCGYFKGTNDLNTAQEQKLDLICRKLQLEKGDRVLDIGCGWGGFAKFAATRYGCKVIGITLSENQAEYAREFCKGLPVEIHLLDYRDIQEKFDKVVSIGMFEHVGDKNYREYMEVVRRCLKEDGLSLLHTIGGKTSAHANDPWLSKYIFPGSVIPSARQVTKATEGLFVIEDWHNFGVYYGDTLRAWWKNFKDSWEGLKGSYDGRFYRMWKYYLLSCAGSFDARHNQLWQIVLSPGGIEGGYMSVR